MALVLTGPLATAKSLYSDIYVFGDSLYDTGNLFGAKFTNRTGPDYYTSAYGPIAIEIASSQLGLGAVVPSSQAGNDYAVGGNTAAQILASITSPSGYINYLGLTTSSYAQDIAAGTQHVNPNALYVLDGGGNDILISGITTVPAAVASANNLVAAAQALLDRGVRYLVMIDVPDVGETPELQNGGDAANATLISKTMNETVLAGLRGVTGNVVLLDISSLQEELVANPAAFGFRLTSQQLVTSCFNDPICTNSGTGAEITGANPNPNTFFFNDGVHPTTIGQQINADYMLSVLRAPSELSLLPEMALDDISANERRGLARLQPSHFHADLDVGGYKLFGGWEHQRSKRDLLYPGGQGSNRADLYSVGVTLRPIANLYLGGMLSRGDHGLQFRGSASDFKMTSNSISVLGGWRSDRVFLDTVATFGDYNYGQLHRVFPLGPANVRTESGDTDGSATAISALGGIDLMPGQALRLGPLLGYSYARIKVHGYREESGRATALDVGRQQHDSSIVSGGLFGDISFSGCDCRLHGQGLYNRQFKDAVTNVSMQIETLPGHSFQLPGYQREQHYWTYSADFDVQITRRIALALTYGGRSGSNDGEWAALSLNASL